MDYTSLNCAVALVGVGFVFGIIGVFGLPVSIFAGDVLFQLSLWVAASSIQSHVFMLLGALQGLLHAILTNSVN